MTWGLSHVTKKCKVGLTLGTTVSRDWGHPDQARISFLISQFCFPLCWMQLTQNLPTVTPCQLQVYILLLAHTSCRKASPFQQFHQSLKTEFLWGQLESCVHRRARQCGWTNGRHSLGRARAYDCIRNWSTQIPEGLCSPKPYGVKSGFSKENQSCCQKTEGQIATGKNSARDPLLY